MKIGDTVRFLNSVGGGRVSRIEGQMAYVEDEDGFETPALVRECVVVGTTDSFYERERPAKGGTSQPPSRQQEPGPVVTNIPVEKPSLPPVKETAEGEKLNLVLGFIPDEIKHLSNTGFDAFIVNDSNYDMYLSVSTRRRDSQEWTLRFAGLVEAAIQEFVFALTTADLPEIDRISVQGMAFKSKTDFRHKATVDFEARLDATKFARLHCFTSNPYFDTDVLAVDIIKDDRLGGASPAPDPELLRENMLKRARDERRAPKPVKKTVKTTGPLEVDLHADALLDTLVGLSSADILNYQIDTFRRVMDENLRHPGREIIFIHGKGEGVLRAALEKELRHRYKGHDVSDASFSQYGFGATRVIIKNVKQ